MSFCTQCGASVNGKFCTTCGASIGDAGAPGGQPAQAPPPPVPQPPVYSTPAPVPAPPAGPQKRGPLFYGLVGCGVLVGLGLLVAISAGIFIAHKAKQAGFDPDLVQRNPTLAAAKMMVAVNPELELVSSDDRRGTVTIREKKTGKSVTLNMEDIKRGHIVFEGDNGERVDINAEGGAARFKSKDGTVEVGANAKLPSWVPAYPGASIQGGVSSNNGDGESGGANLKTSDSVEKVAAFYEDGFKSAGLTVERQTTEGSGNSVIRLSASNDDSRRTATAMIATDGGQTSVTLTFEAKK